MIARQTKEHTMTQRNYTVVGTLDGDMTYYRVTAESPSEAVKEAERIMDADDDERDGNTSDEFSLGCVFAGHPRDVTGEACDPSSRVESDELTEHDSNGTA
jgi:hypothetical protein